MFTCSAVHHDVPRENHVHEIPAGEEKIMIYFNIYTYVYRYVGDVREDRFSAKTMTTAVEVEKLLLLLFYRRTNYCTLILYNTLFK